MDSEDRDIGQGYPEEQEPGASPEGEGEPRSGGDEGKHDDEADSDAGTATGNPDAAG